MVEEQRRFDQFKLHQQIAPRAILASLWSISDDVTALLTVETLKRYRDHPDEGKPAAFQQALRAIRTGKRDDGSTIPGWRDEWSHPAYWGPFSLIAASGG